MSAGASSSAAELDGSHAANPTRPRQAGRGWLPCAACRGRAADSGRCAQALAWLLTMVSLVTMSPLLAVYAVLRCSLWLFFRSPEFWIGMACASSIFVGLALKCCGVQPAQTFSTKDIVTKGGVVASDVGAGRCPDPVLRDDGAAESLHSCLDLCFLQGLGYVSYCPAATAGCGSGSCQCSATAGSCSPIEQAADHSYRISFVRSWRPICDATQDGSQFWIWHTRKFLEWSSSYRSEAWLQLSLLREALAGQHARFRDLVKMHVLGET